MNCSKKFIAVVCSVLLCCSVVSACAKSDKESQQTDESEKNVSSQSSATAKIYYKTTDDVMHLYHDGKSEIVDNSEDISEYKPKGAEVQVIENEHKYIFYYLGANPGMLTRVEYDGTKYVEDKEISSNIKSLAISEDGTKVLYTSPEDTLYVSNIDSKQEIASDVKIYYYNTDFSKVVYQTLKSSDLCFTDGKQVETIDKGITTILWANQDVSCVYYQKGKDLYLWQKNAESRKIFSDVLEIPEKSKVESTGTDTSYGMDRAIGVFEAFVSDQENCMYQYPHNMKFDYPSHFSTDKNRFSIVAFTAEGKMIYMSSNQSYLNIDDVLEYDTVPEFSRKYFEEAKGKKMDTQYLTQLNIYDGTKSIEISNNVLETMWINESDIRQVSSSGGAETKKLALENVEMKHITEDGVLLYTSLSTDLPKIKASKLTEGGTSLNPIWTPAQIVSNWIVNKINSAFYKVNEDYSSTKLVDSVGKLVDIRTSKDKKTLFFYEQEKGNITRGTDVKNTSDRTLYKVDMSLKNPSMQKISDEVGQYRIGENGVCITLRKAYSYGHYVNAVGTLFVDDTEVCNDVFWERIVLMSDGGILYYTEYDRDNFKGTLHYYADGKTTELAKECSGYTYQNKNAIVLYCQEEGQSNTGGYVLAFYDGKSTEIIDKNVQSNSVRLA